jgi:predicted short-subunit dehydrogenase-like oxidoreductase (DUF2520 family)
VANERTGLENIGGLGFVGAGAAGTALARALAARGGRVVAVAARQYAHAEALARSIPGCRAYATPAEVAAASDLVFLAVPDDAIAWVAETIRWSPGQAAVHFSGARDASILAAAHDRGARTAALHPLMTFPRALQDASVETTLRRLAGSSWALEAEDTALREKLIDMVTALDGHAIALEPGARVPYHIAAVFTSNYVVALAGAAVRLWEGFNIPQDEALHALLPLLRAAVESIDSAGLPAALAGPVSRGDLGTIRAHLAWLDEHAANDPARTSLRNAYIALTELAIPLAEAKGTLSPGVAVQLRELLASLRT